MNKILAGALLAVALLTAAQPVFAQSAADIEMNRILQKQLDDSMKELQQSGYEAPKITIPAIPSYQLPPDPFAPPSSVPKVQLKQRCSMIGNAKVCMLGI